MFQGHDVIFMPIDALSVSCDQLTRDLLAIAKFLFHTPCVRRPRYEGGSRQNIVIPFGVGELEWWSYPMVKQEVKVI